MFHVNQFGTKPASNEVEGGLVIVRIGGVFVGGGGGPFHESFGKFPVIDRRMADTYHAPCTMYSKTFLLTAAVSAAAAAVVVETLVVVVTVTA